MMLWVRHFLLLMWKNLLLRQSNFLVTIFELLLPLLMSLTLLPSSGSGPSTNPWSNRTSKHAQHISDVQSEKDILDRVLPLRMVAYAPSNEFTDNVMKSVEMFLRRHNNTPEIEAKETTDEIIDMYNIMRASSNDDNDDDVKLAGVVFDGPFKKYQMSSRPITYRIMLHPNWVETEKYYSTRGGTDTVYINNGFSGIQIAVDKGIIETLCRSGACTTKSMPKINAQRMPVPAYTTKTGDQYVMMVQMPSELMKMMGMSEFMNWFCWMINAMMVLTISVTITVIMWSIDYTGHNPGGVLNQTDPSLFWVFLMLYAMASVTFFFVVSALMKRPILATTVGFILWLVTFYSSWIYGKLAVEYEYMNTYYVKLALCLLPNGALPIGLIAMSIYAQKDIPLNWSNMHMPESIEGDGLTLSHVFLMLTADIVLYLALTWYFSSIMPGDYGVAQPWYFFVMPSYWCPRAERMAIRTSPEDPSSETQIDESSFEREPSDLPVGISIRDIYKVYYTSLTGRQKRAVDGVSLNIYEGQITVLLGHNGAGKTTLMSILTGLFSPTRGTAVINGYDIRTSMQKVQSHLSLCPQHNMLFNELTVSDHMQLFGMLKGLSFAEASREGKSLIAKLRLMGKWNEPSSSLSGGQKRKLSLAIALIGGSKVVMLDEPTSGMDPEARRGVWDMLLGFRGHKTIILTTHIMEEADVLGDRIAIMAHGKVQCCGSPLFLKKHYGTGYILKMTTLSNCHVNKVTQAVQGIIPESQLKAVIGTEVSYLLPTDQTANFPALFETLNANKNGLGIAAFGVSLTTLDEVFLKVGEIADRGISAPRIGHGPLELSLASESSDSPSGPTSSLIKIRGFALLLQQTAALFHKLMLHSMREWLTVIFQSIIAIVLTLSCIYVAARPTGSPGSVKHQPPLTLSLETCTDTVLMIPDPVDQSGYSYYYGQMLPGLVQVKTGQNLAQKFLQAGRKSFDSYQKDYIVAADFSGIEHSNASINAMYGIAALHGAGISINLVDNAILKKELGEDYLITTINHPFPQYAKKEDRIDSRIHLMMPYSMIFAICIFLGLALLAASFVAFPIQETVSKSKQLQLMTGVSPLLYWLTFLLWDMVMYLITVCLMLICLVAVDSRGIYTSGNGLGAIFLLLSAFGWAGITVSYLTSFFAKRVAGGYSLVASLHIFTGISGALTVWEMHNKNEPTLLAVALEWILGIFPAFPACYGLLQFALTATFANQCSYYARDVIKEVCYDLQYNATDKYKLKCCGVCKSDGTCIVPRNYITWNIKRTNEQIPHTGKSTYGVGIAIFSLMLDGCIYLGLILLLESGILQQACNTAPSRRAAIMDQSLLDEDVQNENARVKELPLGTSTVVVKDLSKRFRNFVAVRNVSFAIEDCECFGLLGVNGAGKTTTFRMLTGDETPSSGDAYLLGESVTRSRRAYLSQIGYCPQFDAIIDVLTGKEMLHLYASLRGIAGADKRVQEVRRWVRNLGLQEHKSKPCGTYSGGNKRKLSTAIALIGDPKVVFLDEPTSGVDPTARRNLWQVLAQIKSTGQAVVLTSHSMDECEALCSRLAIMVNGQFQCLGGPQHIKSKFGQGFTVVLKLKRGSEVAYQEGEVSALKSRVESTLAPCVLKDEHQGLLQYHVTNTALSWPFLFRTMESLKNEVDVIEDYSISETTLEQVFLSFARHQ